ncbi:putative DNA polymerase III epsilon subunit [Clostridium bornimense]|uniref:Putative DNA polymerase III epsilon subunit n=1 Tax=Clostridium bornimense TaxID=1216932 RepID=W6RZ78_9CLOT|nr:3'-5' exonuclease [Clostridium bornimense]CDM69788.1 putative DNA polymerase III epsilon subunit [Clostridium bornimense]
MKILMFDTETTGLRPGQICQLSYIVIDNSIKPYKVYGKNFFFSVDFMEESAEQIHGFSKELLEELSGGITFGECYHEFIEDFMNSDIISGHNVMFDIKFIKEEFKRVGIEFTPNIEFCTMKYYKNICNIISRQGDIKNPKLSELMDFLDISEEDIENTSMKLFGDTRSFHDARFDTTAVYMALIDGIRKGYIPPKYFSSMCK